MLSSRISRDTTALSTRINLKENAENKSLDINADSYSDIKFPTTRAVKVYVDSSIAVGGGGGGSSVVDADAARKGIIQLSGDLGGTADAPIVVNSAITNSKIATGAITDVKVASGISASKVGLGNVDNTADIDKQISTATQAALDLKFNQSSATILSNRVDGKLNISDTASMLNDRFKRDTNWLSNRINLKLNIADSVNDYVTLYKLTSSLPDTNAINNRIDLKFSIASATNLSNLVDTKLTKSDTANLSDRINLKMNYADSVTLFATATQIQKLRDDTITLSNRIDNRVKISDTSRMLGNYAIRDNLSQIAITGNYNDLVNKPILATSGVTSVNTLTGAVVIDKSSIDLSQVDNTSDLNKPVSIATSNALITKADIIKSQTATTGGRKFDGNKLEYGLLPPLALKATVEILTFGAEKYERDNWQRVPDSKRRYFDAMQRHLWTWKEGEQNDPETGKNHLAHAMCCLMFLYEHDVKYSLEK